MNIAWNIEQEVDPSSIIAISLRYLQRLLFQMMMQWCKVWICQRLSILHLSLQQDSVF